MKNSWFSWIMLAVIIGAASIALAVNKAPSPPSGDISPLQTVIMGQSTWLAGGPASLRVIVTNHQTGKPVTGAVHLSITPTDQQAIGAQRLFSGPLTDGTLDAKFKVPDLNSGTYELKVRAVTSLGIDVVKRPITISRETQILLTTDKPLYQPGQTLHLRALALRRPNSAPATGDPITLEVEDAKGNKVFKQTETASEYGIVSAEFTLADEINLGTYTIRAISPAGQTEHTVEVKRYVLPKFKLSVTPDRAYYLPGERLTGQVRADYFFGKATSGAQVSLTFATFDVAFNEFAEVKGTTDANGAFRFEVELPKTFVGLPLEQGNAFVKMDLEITDKAEHTEKITSTVPIAKDPLQLIAVPESGALKPGLANKVYILVSTPDGQPAAGASISVSDTVSTARPILGKTDGAGIFELTLPSSFKSTALNIAAKTSAASATKQVTLAHDSGEFALMLRASQALAKVGDTVDFTLLSTKQKGSVYVDVIRDKQTVLTKSLDITNGKGSFALPLTQDLQGTLQVNAYQILPDENIIRDTRLLYVSPADDLVVEVRPNQETYRPGDQAELNFTVRDKQGRPTQAALGLTIVDESVFALQEMQPGLERIYFALEKELLKPRYEIHGFTGEGIISGRLPFDSAQPAQDEALRQKAAAVLFAASAALMARFRTSPATTAKPAPASPALAASTAAFSARRLVWNAISSMVLMIFWVSSLVLEMFSIDRINSLME